VIVETSKQLSLRIGRRV